MDIYQAIILALVQGLSEFLPISSSAHLVLTSKFLGKVDEGLFFDVTLHLASLLAVLTYYRRDIWNMIINTFNKNFKRSMGFYIGISCIPAAFCGLFFSNYIQEYSRNSLVIGINSVLFAIALFLADKKSGNKNLNDLSLKLLLFVAFAQILSLIPGVSRSGICITAALFLGFSRKDSAKLSFLMAIPIILLASGYGIFNIVNKNEILNYDLSLLGISFIICTISSYLCIHFFIKIISKISMLPFIIYRILLGLMLIISFLYL